MVKLPLIARYNVAYLRRNLFDLRRFSRWNVTRNESVLGFGMLGVKAMDVGFYLPL